MDDGGAIRLATRLEARRKHVLLEIEDDGPGMTSTQIGMALRPFHTTKPQGLGLGLPLAKRIVERHGGSLTVTSEPGRGTCVHMLMPAAR
jgi:signal transduction histidine kinase